MMNGLIRCLCLLQFICPVTVLAFDINPVEVGPNIDGSLEEWGAIGMIELDPSDRGVGLRGAFNGLSDHWAGVLLSWDADSLYSGVTVIDDVCDINRINVGENVWKGPNGEKENKMFYYDHLKLFFRDSEKPLGFNLWVKPNCKDSGIYVWGGQQRGSPTDELPIRVASKAKGETYSYELAIPWSWLRIEPFSNMTLKALFLLSDADIPGAELRKKVRRGSKWIWWEGKLIMRGKPLGLPEETDQELASLEVSKVEVETEIKSQLKSVEVAVQKEAITVLVDESVDENDVKNEEELIFEPVVEKVGSDSLKISIEELNEGRVSASQLRMRLQRKLLLGSHLGLTPDWVYEKTQETKLRRSQTDTLYYRLRENLRRIMKENINSRSDGIIIDLADYSGIWRSDARGFVLSLLQNILQDVRAQDSLFQPILREWAISYEIEISKLEKFIEEICVGAIKAYEKGRIVVSNDLFKKARRKSGLSERDGKKILSLIADRI
ncbi:MAG: hypothetical protein VX294_12810 [Candidatus Latescibacterota bacterium]|nr:hypothetical protein [Candidatus Latescibacterota bacterium]